jgi:hypothetical protein
MRRLALVSVVLCVGWTWQSPIKTRPSARPSAVGPVTKPSTCPLLDCRGAPSTRTATIHIAEDAFLMPTPNPICACAEDTIEWTYANDSRTKDKEARIQDADKFLDGDCKTSKRIARMRKAKAGCRILAGSVGRYKYSVVGSHVLDPEVEVQAGVTPTTTTSTPRPPTTTTTTLPSR